MNNRHQIKNEECFLLLCFLFQFFRRGLFFLNVFPFTRLNKYTWISVIIFLQPLPFLYKNQHHILDLFSLSFIFSRRLVFFLPMLDLIAVFQQFLNIWLKSSTISRMFSIIGLVFQVFIWLFLWENCPYLTTFIAFFQTLSISSANSRMSNVYP